MATLILIVFHILAVAAVYVSAYRTGFAVCATDTRREAEARVAPLTEMLERLNLDIDTLLDDPGGSLNGPPCRDEKQGARRGRRKASQDKDPIGR